MINKKGFTLIELLVVVLIIGILAAIALPQYNKAVEKSRASEAVLQLKSLTDAANRFYLQNGTYAGISTTTAGTMPTATTTSLFDNLDLGFTNPTRNFAYSHSSLAAGGSIATMTITATRGSWSTAATPAFSASTSASTVATINYYLSAGALAGRNCNDNSSGSVCKGFAALSTCSGTGVPTGSNCF